jgi:TatA/E family protein of Tat protein translocase
VFTDILQPTHLLFVLVVALLVLGPKRLPEVARSLGSGLRDFRNAISGESQDEHSSHHGFSSDDEDDEDEDEEPETPMVRELEPGTPPTNVYTDPVPEHQPEPVSVPSDPPRVQEAPSPRTEQPESSAAAPAPTSPATEPPEQPESSAAAPAPTSPATEPPASS